MLLGTPPPRSVLALGATLATLVAGGAAWATPRLWAADRPAWAALLAGGALLALKGFWGYWPGLRERRVLRQARSEAERLLRELQRLLQSDSLGEDRATIERAREGLLLAREGGDGGLLGARVAEADVLVRRHAPRGLRRVLLWATAALVLVVLLRVFVVGAFRVASVSMAPTLVVGDVLLVDRTAYAFGRLPERGDVIVWEAPAADGRDFVKRVVALPGDTIAFDGGELLVNGVAAARELVGEIDLDEDGGLRARERFLLSHELWTETLDGSRHATVTHKSAGERSGGPWVVSPGRLFVVGDNRDDSIDSRSEQVGQVPLEQVEGQAVRILFSSGRAGARWARTLAPIR